MVAGDGPVAPAPRDIPDDEATGLVPYEDAAKSMLEATVQAAVDLGHDPRRHRGICYSACSPVSGSPARWADSA
ncbi:hypothetical protein [Gordonia aurantiaca]|uniref:hypothetical protein n=1 Tax=Gordonia sp. B21 TaxID=3151852 RepID=UPI003264F106